MPTTVITIRLGGGGASGDAATRVDVEAFGKVDAESFDKVEGTDAVDVEFSAAVAASTEFSFATFAACAPGSGEGDRDIIRSTTGRCERKS